MLIAENSARNAIPIANIVVLRCVIAADQWIPPLGATDRRSDVYRAAYLMKYGSGKRFA